MGEGGLELELLQVKVRGAPAILGAVFLVQQVWGPISCSAILGPLAKSISCPATISGCCCSRLFFNCIFCLTRCLVLAKLFWDKVISFSPVWKYHMDIIRICWWVVVFLQCEQCTMCTFCWWVGSTNLVSWKSFPLVNSAQCAVCTFCWCVEKLCPSVNSSQSTMCTFCWWVGMLVLFPTVNSSHCAQ